MCSEAHLELLLWLRRLKADPDPVGIDDLSAYISTIAVNACNRYFRQRHPRRAQLKNPDSGHSRHRRPVRCTRSTEQPRWMRSCGMGHAINTGIFRADLEIPIENHRDLGVVLEKMFRAADALLELEIVTDAVARVWAIDRDVPVSLMELNSLPGKPQDIEQSIDRRRYAERLWEEIRTLPAKQRAALLLHLRDGVGNPALSLFPLSGIAFLPAIAATLGLSQTRLSELWASLPLDDNAIAEILGCSRQQVINLRMSARKRLANRMRTKH